MIGKTEFLGKGGPEKGPRTMTTGFQLPPDEKRGSHQLGSGMMQKGATELSVTAKTPPSSYDFGDLTEGMCVIENRTMSIELIASFGLLVGDCAPVHFSAAHARQMGFDQPIAHGLLVSACFSRLLGMYLPGPNTVIQGCRFDFLRPVMGGSDIQFYARIDGLYPSVGAVKLQLECRKHGEGLLARGSAQCIFRVNTQH